MILSMSRVFFYVLACRLRRVRRPAPVRVEVRRTVGRCPRVVPLGPLAHIWVWPHPSFMHLINYLLFSGKSIVFPAL